MPCTITLGDSRAILRTDTKVPQGIRYLKVIRAWLLKKLTQDPGPLRVPEMFCGCLYTANIGRGPFSNLSLTVLLLLGLHIVEGSFFQARSRCQGHLLAGVSFLKSLMRKKYWVTQIAVTYGDDPYLAPSIEQPPSRCQESSKKSPLVWVYVRDFVCFGFGGYEGLQDGIILAFNLGIEGLRALFPNLPRLLSLALAT